MTTKDWNKQKNFQVKIPIYENMTDAFARSFNIYHHLLCRSHPKIYRGKLIEKLVE